MNNENLEIKLLEMENNFLRQRLQITTVELEKLRRILYNTANPMKNHPSGRGKKDDV